MFNSKKRISEISVLLLVVLLLSSCVTTTKVNFTTNNEPAVLFIDGKNKGQTPLVVKMSNGIWNEPDIIIRKNGYQDLHTSIKKDVKPVNLIFGLFLWTPSLLWVYGPKEYQYFEMIEKNE